MTTIKTRVCNVDAELCYRVVAAVEPHLLPRVREALMLIQPLSVVVSRAVSWGSGGQEGFYRGVHYRMDREVARIEVACSERHVEWVVQAVERLIAREVPASTQDSTVVGSAIALTGT